MDTTMLIIRIAAPFFLVFGLSMLLNQKYYLKLTQGLEKQRLFLLWAGATNLILGVLILLHHNLWGSLEEIIASIIGVGALLKALHILLAPNSWLKLANRWSSPRMLVTGSVLVTVIGLALGWIGYMN